MPKTTAVEESADHGTGSGKPGGTQGIPGAQETNLKSNRPRLLESSGQSPGEERADQKNPSCSPPRPLGWSAQCAPADALKEPRGGHGKSLNRLEVTMPCRHAGPEIFIHKILKYKRV